MLPYASLLSLLKVIMMPTKTHKLLLICTGNTCRSQMAHAISHQWALLHELNLEIESRGIRAKAGEATTEEAIIVLGAANIHWQGTSQPLTAADLLWEDDLWGMTQEHLDFVTQLGADLNPDSLPCCRLLAGVDELVDPLNCGLAAYEQLFFRLQELLPKRLAAIQTPSEA